MTRRKGEITGHMNERDFPYLGRAGAAAAQGAPHYADVAPQPEKGQASLVFLELLPDALHKLKCGVEEMRQRCPWAARWYRP
jgi:hypothetical protein